jgi:hypothetical protein
MSNRVENCKCARADDREFECADCAAQPGIGRSDPRFFARRVKRAKNDIEIRKGFRVHVAFTSWIQIQLDRAKDCKLSGCARQRSVCLIAVMPKGLLFPFALSAYPFSSKSKAYLFRQPLGVSIKTFNLPVFRSNGLSFLKNFIRGIIKRTAAPMRRAFLLASALQNKLMLGFRILTLCAAAQQEDQEQNRKWNSQKPKKNVPCGPSLFNFFFQFHRDSIQFS